MNELNAVRSELAAEYVAPQIEPSFAPIEGQRVFRPLNDDELAFIEKAKFLMDTQFARGGSLSNPRDTASYLKLSLGAYKHEIFAILFLDSQNRVIAFEEMFRGTVDGCQVSPREVVKRALHHNAAAVILAHNHPSGNSEPSTADRVITAKLKDALELIGVRILDHLVIGAGEPTSFAQRGWV